MSSSTHPKFVVNKVYNTILFDKSVERSIFCRSSSPIEMNDPSSDYAIKKHPRSLIIMKVRGEKVGAHRGSQRAFLY